MIPDLVSDSELGQWIWENLVPNNGQADTVQGELLRVNEKLRHESHHNGNANWDEGFEILLDFLEAKLCKRKVLFIDPNKKLRMDIKKLRNFKEPYLKDELFDRIESEIFKFCRNNTALIVHKTNENLYR